MRQCRLPLGLHHYAGNGKVEMCCGASSKSRLCVPGAWPAILFSAFRGGERRLRTHVAQRTPLVLSRTGSSPLTTGPGRGLLPVHGSERPPNSDSSGTLPDPSVDHQYAREAERRERSGWPAEPYACATRASSWRRGVLPMCGSRRGMAYPAHHRGGPRPRTLWPAVLSFAHGSPSERGPHQTPQ